MFIYEHKVQYYESDGMGITHHSNYIRWFEEARVALLEHLGYPYEEIEQQGIGSPVLTANAVYKASTRFGDVVQVSARVTAYTGVKLFLAYEVYNRATGVLCCTGETSHCFTDKAGKPLILRRVWPELHEVFAAQDQAAALAE